MSRVPAFSDGARLTQDIPFEDNSGIALGKADDFTLRWDGTFLEAQTIGAQAIWAGAPSPADPAYSSIAYEFFDDFDILRAAWTVTEDHADCTQAVTDANFGVALLTNKASTDDNGQQITFAQETFQLIEGKEVWFEARVRLAGGDATNLDFFVGLAEAEDLTGVADNMPANGIGFHKDDGDTNIDFSSSDNGTNLQSAAIHTLVNNTWIRLGFHFNGGATGSGVLTPYIDGVKDTTVTSVTYATQAEMAPIFMVRNGDGTTTQKIEIDYVKVVQIR